MSKNSNQANPQMLWKQMFGKSASHSFQSSAHAYVLVEGLLSDKLRRFLLLFRAVTSGWMISLPDLQRRSHMDSVRNQLNFPKIYANHSHKANVPFQSLIQLRSPKDCISRSKNLTSISTCCWEACGYRFTHNGKGMKRRRWFKRSKAILVDC